MIAMETRMETRELFDANEMLPTRVTVIMQYSTSESEDNDPLWIAELLKPCFRFKTVWWHREKRPIVRVYWSNHGIFHRSLNNRRSHTSPSSWYISVTVKSVHFEKLGPFDLVSRLPHIHSFSLVFGQRQRKRTNKEKKRSKHSQ